MYRSKCCKARVHVYGDERPEGYICLRCDKACDVVPYKLSKSKKLVKRIRGERMITFEYFPWNNLKIKEYIKRAIPISAVQINEDFEVKTLEGLMRGKAGDYIISGIKGEIYSCNKQIFEESYELYGKDGFV